MNQVKGWMVTASVVALLLILWGGSYLYFRQNMVTTFSYARGSGVWGDVERFQQIEYSSKSVCQRVLYYLHLPWNRLDQFMNKQGAPQAKLGVFW